MLTRSVILAVVAFSTSNLACPVDVDGVGMIAAAPSSRAVAVVRLVGGGGGWGHEVHGGQLGGGLTFWTYPSAVTAGMKPSPKPSPKPSRPCAVAPAAWKASRQAASHQAAAAGHPALRAGVIAWDWRLVCWWALVNGSLSLGQLSHEHKRGKLHRFFIVPRRFSAFNPHLRNLVFTRAAHLQDAQGCSGDSPLRRFSVSCFSVMFLLFTNPLWTPVATAN